MAPFAPELFDAPILNPAVGGFGKPFPYISPSTYKFAPTAMDLGNLVPNHRGQSQEQALASVINRACGRADRFCFGADPAAKGASLCATLSVESTTTMVKSGEIRLVCDYKPIIGLMGLAVGTYPGDLCNVGSAAANFITFGRKVIYVPAWVVSPSYPGSPAPFLRLGVGGALYVVWSYINGYPHTYLTEAATAGESTVTVQASGPNDSVYGVFPGTQLDIVDDTNRETITVASSYIGGLTLPTTTPLLYNHSVPDAPDFVSVTAIPADVEQALIFMTTHLIKSRGDASMVLDELIEPRASREETGASGSDLFDALELLNPFRAMTKIKN
jgi:hypothetical protein